MASIPLPALALRTQQPEPDLLGQYGKLVALKGLMQNQQFQQQMQPLQLQQEQQAVQKQQMEFDSQNGLMQSFIQARGDPDKTLLLASSPGSKVLPQHLMAFQNQQIEYQKNLQTKNETELKNMDSQGYNLRQLLDPILQAPEDQQSALWTAAKLKVATDPQALIKYGTTGDSIPDYQNPDQVKLFDATLLGHEKAIADTQKQAQAAKDVADAQKAIAETPGAAAEAKLKQAQQVAFEQWSSRSQNQGKNYTDYLAEQAGTKAAAEAKARQPYEMALASFNRQTAMTNVMAEHAMNSITDIFTNPQHGYSQTLSQLSASKEAVASSQNGSQLAANLAPLMTALGVTSFAGVHRINQTEINAAGPQVGSILRQIDARLEKWGQGKLAPGTASEMTQLMDTLLDAKYNTVVQGAKVAAANGGIDPSRVTVMDKTGGLVRLSDVKNTPAGGIGGGQMIRARDANHVLHEAPAGTPLPAGWTAEK